MAVPYTFGSATTSIPLSQLDSNFATTITLGNTAIQLGNTVTTLNNMTLANATVSSGNATVTTLTAPTHNSASSLTFQTNGTTTAITVDTSQNVGINQTSPTVIATAKQLAIKAPTNGDALFVSQNSNGLTTFIAGYYGVTAGPDKPVVGSYSNDPVAFITNNTERMRIGSGGIVSVGTTLTDNPLGGFVLYVANQNSQFMIGHETGASSGNAYAKFCYNGSSIGTITQNGTTGVLYNLTSDYRLKNNPVALTGAKDFVMALQPKTWDWWDDSGKGVGFIAHEFMEVAKHSGHGEKDASHQEEYEVTPAVKDQQGNITTPAVMGTRTVPDYQSIQPSSSEVMANMVAFIQEQQATITALTARIVALEAK
jgi:hypothetical protein